MRRTESSAKGLNDLSPLTAKAESSEDSNRDNVTPIGEIFYIGEFPERKLTAKERQQKMREIKRKEEEARKEQAKEKENAERIARRNRFLVSLGALSLFTTLYMLAIENYLIKPLTNQKVENLGIKNLAMKNRKTKI